MLRKTILLALTVFTLLVFVACAGATPQTNTGTETEAEAAPAQEVAAEEVAKESASEDAEAVAYTVDPEASTVEWYGSKPIGKSESGTVTIAGGQLVIAGTSLVEGAVTIDMTSIETSTQNGNMKDMLEGHLKSDEFFGVETYPEAALVIKSVEPTDVDNQFSVVADLTIKETTDEIEFVADVEVGDGTLEATADVVVDRSIYDVRYGSGSFFSDLGDDLISDEMELTITLVARS